MAAANKLSLESARMPHSKKVGSPTKNLLRGAFRELLVEKLMQLSRKCFIFE
jgi:hypothetical protein